MSQPFRIPRANHHRQSPCYRPHMFQEHPLVQGDEADLKAFGWVGPGRVLYSGLRRF